MNERELLDVLHPERVGITYAMASKPYDGWVKIGRSGGRHHGQSAAARLAKCQTGNPRELTIRAVWDVDLEALLHAAYAEFRGNGEWFALPVDLVNYMGIAGRRKRPGAELLMEWPVRRVWEKAGGRSAARTPEGLARIFMPKAASVQLCAV